MLHGAVCAVGFRIQTDLNIEDSEDPQQFYNTALFAQLSSSSVCSGACLHAFGCVLSVFFSPCTYSISCIWTVRTALVIALLLLMMTGGRQHVAVIKSRNIGR